MLRWFSIVHTVVELVVGTAVVLFPTLLSVVSSAELTEDEGLQFARLFGASLICMAILTWMIRDRTRPESLVPALMTVTAYHAFVATILVYGQLMGFRSLAAWFFPIGHAGFSLGFGFLLATLKPR
jgi:hypothetical protein